MLNRRGLTRQLVLGVNVAIAALVLGKTLLDPTIGQPRPATLPETIELEQWSLSHSEPLPPFTLITGEADHALVGQRYTYHPKQTLEPTAPQPKIDQNVALTIELRYMLDTNGFIERLLMGHDDFQTTLTAVPNPEAIKASVRYQSGIGHYGQFQIQDQTHLSACINPRGESTFSIDQFLHNQNIYDGNPNRLLSVLFGRDVWADQRCLWTHMVLESSLSPKETETWLMQTWAEWYAIWQPQFPKR